MVRSSKSAPDLASELRTGRRSMAPATSSSIVSTYFAASMVPSMHLETASDVRFDGETSPLVRSVGRMGRPQIRQAARGSGQPVPPIAWWPATRPPLGSGGIRTWPLLAVPRSARKAVPAAERCQRHQASVPAREPTAPMADRPRQVRLWLRTSAIGVSVTDARQATKDRVTAGTASSRARATSIMQASSHGQRGAAHRVHTGLRRARRRTHPRPYPGGTNRVVARDVAAPPWDGTRP